MSKGDIQKIWEAKLRPEWAWLALDFCEQPLAILSETDLDRPVWLNRAMRLWWQAHGIADPTFVAVSGQIQPDLPDHPGSCPPCRVQRLEDPEKGFLLLVGFLLPPGKLESLTAETLLGGICPVTEIADRVALDCELSERFSRAADRPFALIFIDLDGFKAINDTLGHLAGDRSLRSIAKKLHGSVRDTDFVGRFGGDEFVVLLSGIRTERELHGPLTRLREAILEDSQPALGASFGAALSSEDFSSAEAMLNAADKRMYRAKRQTAASR